jgi:hypothetical protein
MAGGKRSDGVACGRVVVIVVEAVIEHPMLRLIALALVLADNAAVLRLRGARTGKRGDDGEDVDRFTAYHGGPR